MKLTGLSVIFVISLAFVLISIIKYKLHPFLALLIGGLVMGVGSGIDLIELANGIAAGFGGTLEAIGIIIILGVALGHLLHVSGCTSQIAILLLKATGEKRAPLAINLTGAIVSIPVFFDAAFVILVNLIKSISRKGKVPFVTLVTALAVGLITTHAMVIPTPGPIAVAGTMGVNIGWFLLYGIIAAIPASLVGGVVYGRSIGNKTEFSSNFADSFNDAEEEASVTEASKKLPSGGLGIFLIILPIIIILLGTIASLVLEEGSTAYTIFSFLGNKNIALLIGTIVAFLMLKPYLGISINDAVGEAATQAGSILAITGAGGAFGEIIKMTGIGDLLVDSMSGLMGGNGVGLIIAAFVISIVLRGSQGSTTVALVTTSAMFAPVVASLPNISPLLVGVAICAGGIGLSLPNDSGFWVVSRFSNFSTKQTLQAWTVGGTISSITALIVVIILSFFTTSLPGLL